MADVADAAGPAGPAGEAVEAVSEGGVLVAVPAEVEPGERRVALVPEAAGRLVAQGLSVSVQSGAGAGAFHSDEAYADAGCRVLADGDALLAGAQAVLHVRALTPERVALLRPGTTTIGMYQPAADPALARHLADAGVTALSLDLVPRISRAQAMDALSSQALVAGYRAAVVAAQMSPRFFPLLMTAAGTVPPARVLVLGTGVAGLQAIATARRLGATVEAYDVRAAAAEEVRSLGARFLELDLATQEGAGGYARVQDEDFLARQRELLGNAVAAADVVITTAAVPGRPAPVLVTLDMVEAMRPGSVVVDLAAETGGNVEPSEPGQDVRIGDVLVVGARNFPALMPVHASALYSRNVSTLLQLVLRDGVLDPDFDDEIVAGCCVTHGGEVVHGPTRALLEREDG